MEEPGPSRARPLRFRGASPAGVKARVREALHRRLRLSVGNRPEVVERAGVRLEPWKYGAYAAVCVSADLELAWASQYVTLDRAIEEGRRTREVMPELLDTFASVGVPVTWATVGHLFLHECRRENGRPHPEMPRPSPYSNRYWSFLAGDWYQNDPCTGVREDPEWYAPDLLDSILKSAVAHEIGCHSFSHTDLSDRNAPSRLARAEISRCKEEARARGLRLRSFVFPGNFEGNFRVLKEEGFVAYRGHGEAVLSYPSRDHGMWNIRSSLQLFDPSVDYRLRTPRYIALAIRTGTACHLNFHPWAADADSVRSILRPTLSVLKKFESRGDLWIATMGEIADFCEVRTNATLSAIRDSETLAGWRVDWGVDTIRHPLASLTLSVPWQRTLPRCEIDGVEQTVPSRALFVRDGRLYITVDQPSSEIRLT